MSYYKFFIFSFISSLVLIEDLSAQPTALTEADRVETVARVLIPEADAACGAIDDYHGMKVLIEARNAESKDFHWAATLAFSGKGSAGAGCQSIQSKIRMEFVATKEYASGGGAYSTATFYGYTHQDEAGYELSQIRDTNDYIVTAHPTEQETHILSRGQRITLSGQEQAALTRLPARQDSSEFTNMPPLGSWT